VAYSSRYIVGLWMGNPDNHPMNRVAGAVSAVYVARIMRFLHPLQEQGIDTEPFPLPEGAQAVRICALSGQEAGPDCPSTTLEYFRPLEAPHASCMVHRRIAVDKTTGRPAGPATPPSRVALRPATLLPAIYSLWGARHGYNDPPPEAGRAEPGYLEISYPRSGGRYMLDPGIPSRFQTLPLEASVQPRVRLIAWYVDGRLFAKVRFPYAVRLPLTKGVHRIQAALPDSDIASSPVTITVD
jgi:membrane carboxypeptidase/penicillin-binding protein PbpC